METFNFNCPQCKNLLSAEDEWRGMETQCPYCQKTIIIPLPLSSIHSPKYFGGKRKLFIACIIVFIWSYLRTGQIISPYQDTIPSSLNSNKPKLILSQYGSLLSILAPYLTAQFFSSGQVIDLLFSINILVLQ